MFSRRRTLIRSLGNEVPRGSTSAVIEQQLDRARPELKTGRRTTAATPAISPESANSWAGARRAARLPRLLPPGAPASFGHPHPKKGKAVEDGEAPSGNDAAGNARAQQQLEL